MPAWSSAAARTAVRCNWRARWRSVDSRCCDSTVRAWATAPSRRASSRRGGGGGCPVLRFDRSGLGDSPVPAGVVADRSRLELRAAMDLVAARTGARRFVVGGICSAADNAFRLAAVEPHIDGLLMLDGLAYRTPG